MPEITDGLLDLPLSYDRGERTMTIHPAAVETRRGLLLLDVGLPGSVDQIESLLSETGHDLASVHGVVLTHHDGDHAGGLADLLEVVDATVFAHHEEAPYVDGRRAPLKGGGDDRYPPAPVDVAVTDGVTFETEAGPMEVVATPGHTPGHVSLYFPDQHLLVAADALTAEDGLNGPNPQFSADVDLAMESVGNLAELDVDHVLCYHGGFVEEGDQRIQAIYDAYRG